MARQKGIVKIKGTLDDMTFYKSKDGYLVKTKSAVSKDRIKNDPGFVRTRENMEEFKNAATGGKYLRDTIHAMLRTISDQKMNSRLLAVMMNILKQDTTSVRGQRRVDIGIGTPAGKAFLKGFEFNRRSQIRSVLFRPFTVTTLTGVITISNLVPMNDVALLQGATDITLRGAYANVDFKTGVNVIDYTNEVNLPIDGTSTTVTLTPTAVPPGVGTKIYFLQIEFFQTVNAVQYELNNGIYNALVVAEVA